MSHVDLGFAEECQSWQVASYQFPSKIGGKPAWLDPENLPKPAELQCSKCGQVMCFLCQVYAPYEEDDANFHRTLFVFICRNSECCVRNSSDNVKVFRNCLERKNKFYSFEPPAEGENRAFRPGQWAKLCNLCGCLSKAHCSKCQTAYYCSREHQVLDWKEQHRETCLKSPLKNPDPSQTLFSEFELVIEAELDGAKPVNEQEQLQKLSQLQLDGKTGTMSEVPEAELDAHTLEEDKVFSKFRTRIDAHPDQVLRYERGGQPLWIAESPLPEVPNCANCGALRQFEFQIMPQLLSVLRENALDWGVLAVFSCVSSCRGNGYLEEFVFKQDVTV